MSKMNKTKVAIVKVENDDVESAVRKIIELLGGLEKFIGNASEVILKPNLLSAPKDPETRAKIRTDPRILDALSKMLGELKRNVVIGDTCGMGHSGGTREVLKHSGYLELGEKYDFVDVRSLAKNGPITVDVQGHRLTTVNISKDIVEAEAIINLPKMKTHSMTLYTGAIKNLFGTVVGEDKTRIHSLGATIHRFSQCLVDIYAFEKPRIKLNIMDAIIALEGSGPGAGGRAVRMNLLLASEDAVALDAVAFRLMGHNPKKVPATKFAAEQGLGLIEKNQIEVVGEKLEKHTRKFKLPISAALARIPFQKFSTITMRVPNYISGCTECGNCERACPEKVITLKKAKDGKIRPFINYKGCISCYTCLEVCPEACYKSKPKYLGKIIWISVIIAILIAVLATLLAIFL
ncbi:MAG: DUF362 domain-containing protein [Asgard group archaeon]|nr:DUF362 domain-containing protein [Asgard group archaeon]